MDPTFVWRIPPRKPFEYSQEKSQRSEECFWKSPLDYEQSANPSSIWICLVAEGYITQHARLSDSVSLSHPSIPSPMAQPGAVRKPYTGQKKAIAIALDVGTTFSGVSYALLDPGQIPKIYEVTRLAFHVPPPPHFRFTLTDVLPASFPSSPLLTLRPCRNTWADVIAHRSFPGQEHQAGNPKIPSVIWYDRHGDAVKAGAEAEEQSNINTAEEQGWIKVEL